MRPLAAPVKVTVDVTGRCNLHCEHCRTGPEDPERSLTRGDLEAIFTDLAEIRVFRLGLSGGEPFLRDDLPHLVRFALERGIPRVFLSTNGTRLGAAHFQPLVPFRDRITFKVSIDGPARIHDTVRGRAGAFDAALDAIERLRREGFTVHVTTALTRRTAASLDETLRIVCRTGARAHHVVEVVASGRAGPEQLLTPAERRRARETIRRTERENGPPILAKLPFLDDEGFGFTCDAGIRECGILADGRIVGCRLLPDLFEGDVRERPISAVWRDPGAFAFFRRDRAEALGESCRGCGRWESCRGGCPASAARVGDRPAGPDLRCPRAR